MSPAAVGMALGLILVWSLGVSFPMFMIYAPVFYRLLVGHLPLDLHFADSLVTRALALLAGSDGLSKKHWK